MKKILIMALLFAGIFYGTLKPEQGGSALKPHSDLAFETAIKDGNVSKVREIFRTRPHSDLLTFLPWAASFENLDIVKLFVENGAGINYETPSGDTALSRASSGGYLGVVKWLVEHGAAINHRNPSGRTPLFDAAVSGHLDVVEWLSQHGAEIHVQDIHGQTPLFGAAELNNTATSEWLIQHDYDVNHKDKAGRTAIFEPRNEDMIAWLVEKGADINLRDASGKTPLSIAALFADIDRVEALIEHGAEQDDNLTILCKAIRRHPGSLKRTRKIGAVQKYTKYCSTLEQQQKGSANSSHRAIL